MSEGAETFYMRMLRRLRAMISVVTRAKQFQFSQLEGTGIERGMRVSAGTIGFGNLGDRAPVSDRNLRAYTRMLLRVRGLINKYGDEEDKETFQAFVEALEVELFARSHRGESVLGPIAEAVAELADIVRRLPSEEGEESKE